MKKILQKLYFNLHLLIIPICCGAIIVFWTYLLLQQEVRNSLYLLYSNFSLNSLIFSILTVSVFWLFKKFKEFKQELFDKIEREHRNTLSFLYSRLTEEITNSTKAILLQKVKK